jgi:hypothetical protein
MWALSQRQARSAKGETFLEKKLVNVNLKTSPTFKARLVGASQILDRPYARIVREAVDDKLKALAKNNAKLRRFLDKQQKAA